jgi:hypothetical protein
MGIITPYMHIDDILSEKLPDDIPYANKIYILLWLVFFIRRNLSGKYIGRKIDCNKLKSFYYYPMDNTYVLYDKHCDNILCFLQDGVKPVKPKYNSKRYKTHEKKIVKFHEDTCIILIEYDDFWAIYFMDGGIVYRINNTCDIECINTNSIYELLPDDIQFYCSIFTNHMLYGAGDTLFIPEKIESTDLSI